MDHVGEDTLAQLPPNFMTTDGVELPADIDVPFTPAAQRVIERSVDLFIDNLRRDRAGEPLRNVVDLEAGY